MVATSALHVVMAREGGPSTTFLADISKDVVGGPSPAMTGGTADGSSSTTVDITFKGGG
jgi:hypothetical protein